MSGGPAWKRNDEQRKNTGLMCGAPAVRCAAHWEFSWFSLVGLLADACWRPQAKTNKNSVPYNPLTLKYNDDLDGKRLQCVMLSNDAVFR